MPAELPKEVQEDLLRLQAIQRQLQMIVAQEQQLEMENMLIEQALAELKECKGKVYKNIGGIIIEKNKEAVEKELEEKKENNKLKLDTLKKQEERLKNNAKSLQEKIEEALKKLKK